jgi:hypothetical protein
MKAENIQLHDFDEPSYSKLSELSETTYPGKEISKENYLQWEYDDNPDGRALISVAEQNGLMVAQYILIPRLYSIENSIYSGSLSVNTLTHPGFRGRNLFPQLASYTFSKCIPSNINFTIGFPNPYSLPVIRKNKLFQETGSLAVLINPLTVFKSTWNYFLRKKEKSGKEIPLQIHFKKTMQCISAFDVDNDRALYEQFLSAFNSEKQNVTKRSWEFLIWRYMKIPYRKYYLFKLVEGGVMKGWFVFRAKYIYGLRCGILVDICLLNNTLESGAGLDTIRAVAEANHLDMVITALPGHSEECKMLMKNGYRKLPSFLLPQRLTLMVRKHRQECPEGVTNFKKWFLTFGDYDIF